MKKPLLLALFVFTSGFRLSAAPALEPGFVSLMDGKSFEGWVKSNENPDTWSIVDGTFVAKGPRCHLFYDGANRPFKNFHLKVEVMTLPGSNGGIYFHTRFQESGWPEQGFECQVNVTHKDWRKTGSIYGVADVGVVPVKDNQWWTQEVIVEGESVKVLLDGKVMLNYTQPKGAQAGERFLRVFGEGTFALQGHDPKSEIHYRNIRVKRLDD